MHATSVGMPSINAVGKHQMMDVACTVVAALHMSHVSLAHTPHCFFVAGEPDDADVLHNCPPVPVTPQASPPARGRTSTHFAQGTGGSGCSVLTGVPMCQGISISALDGAEITYCLGRLSVLSPKLLTGLASFRRCVGTDVHQ